MQTKNRLDFAKITNKAKNLVTSPGSMQDTGSLGRVHWDNPEGWYEVGAGFRMGNTCTPVVDACRCMAKPIQYCKVKKKKKKLSHFNNSRDWVLFSSFLHSGGRLIKPPTSQCCWPVIDRKRALEG